MNDKYILDNYFGPTGKINGNKSTESYLKEHDLDAYDYLINRYPDSESIRETLLRIKYGIERRSECPICHKPVRYNGHKNLGLYDHTCGETSCIMQYRKSSIINKYGEYVNFGGTPESQQKIMKTKSEKYGDPFYNNREKSKQTCLKKYNRTYSLDIEHVKAVCIERYGGIGGASPEILEKIKKTCLERYGVDNYRKSPECVLKILKTKLRNNTVCSSKIEETCYEWLKNYFGEADILRQYVDDRYKHPISGKFFHCDFYIKSLDVFIEIQGHWGHGSHPYNPEDPNDKKIVETWEKKEKQCYFTAIQTWTIRDPYKRMVAQINNLKYYELFDMHITESQFINQILELIKN